MPRNQEETNQRDIRSRERFWKRMGLFGMLFGCVLAAVGAAIGFVLESMGRCNRFDFPNFPYVERFGPFLGSDRERILTLSLLE